MHVVGSFGWFNLFGSCDWAKLVQLVGSISWSHRWARVVFSVVGSLVRMVDSMGWFMWLNHAVDPNDWID